MLEFISDNYNPSSLASKSRKKRFDFFLYQLRKFKKPVKILDIGGTEKYWSLMGFPGDRASIRIYLLNKTSYLTKSKNIISINGDATNLSEFNDASFDIVYSNSVIEHLFTWENQVKMANEVQRVGKNYFIQTPNYYFPIEPHFVFPFFQYLPKSLQVKLITNFSFGHFNKFENEDLAIKKVEEISLLTLKQMKELFPKCSIYIDKFIGLNKSIVTYSFNNIK